MPTCSATPLPLPPPPRKLRWKLPPPPPPPPPLKLGRLDGWKFPRTLDEPPVGIWGRALRKVDPPPPLLKGEPLLRTLPPLGSRNCEGDGPPEPKFTLGRLLRGTTPLERTPSDDPPGAVTRAISRTIAR